MRTTLTLDPDVAAKAKKGAAKLGKPFKEIVNAALRIGLDQVLKPPASKPYRTRARPLGLRRGLQLRQHRRIAGTRRRRGPSVILVDANLLLYAEDSLSEHHQTARDWGAGAQFLLCLQGQN